MTRLQGLLVVVFGLLFGCFSAAELGASSSSDTATASGAGGSSAVSSATSGAGGSGAGKGGAGGGTTCDDLGDCGDYKNGCSGCVVKGVCAEPYNACFSDQRCASYNKCLIDCQADLACKKACADQNAIGAQLYQDLITCVACDGCPQSCASLSLCK